MKRAPRLSAIDLNLLTVFDAVLRERSTTRAGKLLGLSQPAVSHALARLRHALKDELFVRMPQGMTPTPRAEQLALPVRAAIDGLRDALETTDFDPGIATTSFRIAVDNYAAIVLVPRIVSRLARLAPNIALDFRPSGTLDVPDLLDCGELHLCVGPPWTAADRFTQRELVKDEFVVAMRRDHPLGRRKDISSEMLAATVQLEISSAQFADGASAAKALPKPNRRAVVRAPILAASRILATSDLIAVLPLKVAIELGRGSGLVHRSLARARKPVETSMTWLRRLDNSPSHAWLRNEIAKAVGA